MIAAPCSGTRRRHEVGRYGQEGEDTQEAEDRDAEEPQGLLGRTEPNRTVGDRGDEELIPER